MRKERGGGGSSLALIGHGGGGGGVEDGCRGSIMCWLYGAGKVIYYVRSRLWQNSIFIITLLLYLSIIVVVPSFSPSLSPLFSPFSLSLALSLFFSLYLPLSLWHRKSSVKLVLMTVSQSRDERVWALCIVVFCR